MTPRRFRLSFSVSFPGRLARLFKDSMKFARAAAT
jgi:hypothetical protein